MKPIPRLGRALLLPLLLTGSACDDDKDAGAPSADGTGTVGVDGEDDAVEDSGGDGSTSGAFFSQPERETILAWLGPLPEQVPADLTNQYADDPGAATLGQTLFFDPGFSSTGQVSCATCHDPASAFSDNRSNTSEGVGFTGRSSMSVLNTAYGAAAEQAQIYQFWDGRRDSQWSQALGPVEDANEMGSTRTATAQRIAVEYPAEYEAVFGSLPALPAVDATVKPGDPEWDALSAAEQDAINTVFVNFGKAVAAYERRLVSRNSRFDRFWQDLADGAQDSDALTVNEKHGLRVFIDKGRCLGCHSGPNFTDGQFHNIAVAQLGSNVPSDDDGRKSGLPSLLADEFNCNSQWSDYPDKGACTVNELGNATGELGAFKTPSLRSVNLTPPYMHTGAMASLDAVIAHYDLGGSPTGTFAGIRDELMRPLGLDLPQRRALADFLVALEGEPVDPALLSEQ